MKKKLLLLGQEQVKEVERLFNNQIAKLIELLNENTEFYYNIPDTNDEAKQRVIL